jgi:hypothetical protein
MLSATLGVHDRNFDSITILELVRYRPSTRSRLPFESTFYT